MLEATRKVLTYYITAIVLLYIVAGGAFYYFAVFNNTFLVPYITSAFLAIAAPLFYVIYVDRVLRQKIRSSVEKASKFLLKKGSCEQDSQAPECVYEKLDGIIDSLVDEIEEKNRLLVFAEKEMEGIDIEFMEKVDRRAQEFYDEKVQLEEELREKRDSQEKLRRRDHMLMGVAETTKLLLDSFDSFDTQVAEAVCIIGKASGFDRVRLSRYSRGA